MVPTNIAMQRIAEAAKYLDKAEELLTQAQERTYRLGAMLELLIARRKAREV